ncbi:MAG: cell division protein ZapA [Deltaproteobacteria bacterium]|jgi:cell division protein ZapA|nr:cell division protein ZapA [Deltaproteobacteria bacterium]
MQTYSLDVLGLDISFKADADPERLEQARLMLETRFAVLKQHGRHLTKDRLLTFLALALADDLIEAQGDLDKTEKKVRRIMAQIDNNVM